jgi:N-acetyl-gamma-glutamyl-phosphate reductase
MQAIKKTKIGIFGSTGYTGLKLIDLILEREDLEIVFIGSEQHKGKPFTKEFPNYQNRLNLNFSGLSSEFIETLNKDIVEFVFFATPNGVCFQYAPTLINKGIHVIDLSADYRFRDIKTYEKWYGFDRQDLKTNQEAIYGLVEFNHTVIEEKAKSQNQGVLIGNPGCYTTASILALTPLFLFDKENLDLSTIIIDGKSGISGAGRKAETKLLYSELNESCSPYNLGGKHRHIPELETFFSEINQEPVGVIFSPHLIPMTQGLLITSYVKTKNENFNLSELKNFYKKTYEKFPLNQILDDGVYPQTSWAVNSNRSYIQIDFDSQKSTLIITCAIDNLVKGAGGQGLQNMDLIIAASC